MNVPRSARRTLIAALSCALALVLLRATLRPDYQRRNLRVFTEMRDSLAQESFGASAFLPGGTTQQPLVAGVVIAGETPFRYGSGTEEAQRAGRDLASPLAPDDAAARARGATLYASFCVACHGADGGGRGPVVERGMLPPPSLLGARARTLPDGEIFHIITRGQGNMAPHAAQLTPTERWQVITHLLSMQEQQ